jgi:hypothetical protein
MSHYKYETIRLAAIARKFGPLAFTGRISTGDGPSGAVSGDRVRWRENPPELGHNKLKS